MAELPTLSSPTRDAIFAAYEAQSGDGFRPHLGASLIGKDCERALWFDFRWTTVRRHPGRLLRLMISALQGLRPRTQIATDSWIRGKSHSSETLIIPLKAILMAMAEATLMSIPQAPIRPNPHPVLKFWASRIRATAL